MDGAILSYHHNIVIINMAAPMRRCGDRLVFANCCGQSLKSVASLAHPSFAHNIAAHLPQDCHTYHTPPKITLRPRTTHESILQLQPFIVATITQWAFNDSPTNEMKPHFVLLIHISVPETFKYILSAGLDHFVASVPPPACPAGCPP